ncbi:hypothetical protein BGP77_15390 [Saccharospirillum sp. MSK14-1]|uniref:hypothetical protein n=1 Tax=Saccharospirillum sp. MSK14-1 TaxID=1897632 RepID=UPI000D388AAB|nr:hypothetical protein [Saccharospirillum sp. MSK14-1]PTY37854.1 hypothetical protein BGP77_15390 [Saccharospirillum sp. MSK14-1]
MTERELRSDSVTLLAWVFIVLAALMTLIGIAQNLLIYWLYPDFLLQLSRDLESAPPLARFLAAHLDWLVGLFTALSATLFIAAIGVLNRFEWSRKLFINVLIVGLAWKVINLILMTLFMAELPLARASTLHGPADVENFQTLMVGFNAMLTIAIGAILIRICHYLSLPKVTVEFGGLGDVDEIIHYQPKENH